MKTKFFIILFLFSAGVISLQAQSAGGSFMLGFPQGDFKDNVDRAGYGFQVQGTLWEPNSHQPFALGLNLGFLIYGEESETRPLSTTIPDVFVDVNRTNSLVNFHLLFQLSPFEGGVRPYAEGLFGGAYIFTTTDVESQNSGDNVFETNNFDDFTWSYGAGGGLLIKLLESEEDFSNLFLDIKARYLFGTKAEYLKEGSVTIEDGEVFYDVVESETDLLMFHLGVVFYF